GENRELTRRLLAEAAVRIQVGGGVTSDDGGAELGGWGATRVVIGTAAAVDAVLVARLLGRYGADRLAVGIDARDGRVAARGSDVRLALAPLELARRLRGQGARTVIYTDAARDGSLAGPDVDGARAIAALGEGLDVIVSGGVASLDDLRRVRDAGLAGARRRSPPPRRAAAPWRSSRTVPSPIAPTRPPTCYDPHGSSSSRGRRSSTRSSRTSMGLGESVLVTPSGSRSVTARSGNEKGETGNERRRW